MPPWIIAFLLAAGVFVQAPTLRPDPARMCGSCAEWNVPREPFRIFGNAYYVGTAGLSSLLITSDQGHILLDGGLPQSAPAIDANIRALGFKTTDVKLIAASHEHYDHVGGIAALQRFTGAAVAASPAAARALAAGMPTDDDPQIAFGREASAFPAVRNVRIVRDGQVLTAGPIALTAHLTPGHTPGATTWSWQSCEGARCLNVVYVDSLNPVSADGFRFTGDATHASRVPEFRASLAKVAALPCDIVISVHPGATDVAGKLKRWQTRPDVNPFIDASACTAYAKTQSDRLDARVADERR
jgi:metallo-beta-lactamase class B